MKQLLLDLLPPAAPTFDNLVCGANAELINAVAHIACGDFKDRILYLWGEPGAGKTHVCEAVLQRAPCAVRMVSDALPDAPDAPALYVLDDVDSLAPDAQARLFNFLNQLGASTMLITGSGPPRDLALRRDLTTRIGGGLTYQMKPLSDAEKQAALLAHAQTRGMALSPEIAGYLLRHGRRDMRSLVAILDAIDRFSLETGRAVTLPMVREAVSHA